MKKLLISAVVVLGIAMGGCLSLKEACATPGYALFLKEGKNLENEPRLAIEVWRGTPQGVKIFKEYDSNRHFILAIPWGEGRDEKRIAFVPKARASLLLSPGSDQFGQGVYTYLVSNDTYDELFAGFDRWTGN